MTVQRGIVGYQSSSGSAYTLGCRPPLHDRHVDAGAALSIDQFDSLRHCVGIFAAVHRFSVRLKRFFRT